jgi:hypothetical protein
MAQYGAIKNQSEEFNDSEANSPHLRTNTYTKVPARSGRTISIFALIAGIFLLFSGIGTYSIANKGQFLTLYNCITDFLSTNLMLTLGV